MAKLNTSPSARPFESSVANQLLAEVLVAHALPMRSLLESPYFKRYVNYLNKNYDKPGFKTVDRIIDDMHTATRENIAEVLLRAAKGLGEKWCCVAADEYTSSTQDRFLGITVSFVQADWDICCLNLAVLPYSGVLNIPAMAANVASTLASYGLEPTESVRATVNDGAALCVGAMHSFGDYNRHCDAHRMDLAVRTALGLYPVPKPGQPQDPSLNRGMRDVVAEVKNIVAKVNMSPKVKEALAATRKTLELEGCTLKSDVATRW